MKEIRIIGNFRNWSEYHEVRTELELKYPGMKLKKRFQLIEVMET